jgi:dTDP-4-dehydrorhamnose 3,5-epimerase
MDMRVPKGVVVRSLNHFADSRGYLRELFRTDEIPNGFSPAMAYISVTHPNVSRGPHEHTFQSDLFCFVDGTYELRLWENRKDHEKLAVAMVVGADNPVLVKVPPGVVHGYKNIGPNDAMVLNFPDRLYAGEGKTEPVDEIRHESDSSSQFSMEGDL